MSTLHIKKQKPLLFPDSKDLEDFLLTAKVEKEDTTFKESFNKKFKYKLRKQLRFKRKFNKYLLKPSRSLQLLRGLKKTIFERNLWDTQKNRLFVKPIYQNLSQVQKKKVVTFLKNKYLLPNKKKSILKKHLQFMFAMKNVKHFEKIQQKIENALLQLQNRSSVHKHLYLKIKEIRMEMNNQINRQFKSNQLSYKQMTSDLWNRILTSIFFHFKYDMMKHQYSKRFSWAFLFNIARFSIFSNSKVHLFKLLTKFMKLPPKTYYLEHSLHLFDDQAKVVEEIQLQQHHTSSRFNELDISYYNTLTTFKKPVTVLSKKSNVKHLQLLFLFSTLLKYHLLKDVENSIVLKQLSRSMEFEKFYKNNNNVLLSLYNLKQQYLHSYEKNELSLEEKKELFYKKVLLQSYLKIQIKNDMNNKILQNRKVKAQFELTLDDLLFSNFYKTNFNIIKKVNEHTKLLNESDLLKKMFRVKRRRTKYKKQNPNRLKPLGMSKRYISSVEKGKSKIIQKKMPSIIITSTFTNTAITLLDTNNKVLKTMSCGQVGFKKAKRSTYYAANELVKLSLLLF
jgi:hypothetical protein